MICWATFGPGWSFDLLDCNLQLPTAFLPRFQQIGVPLTNLHFRIGHFPPREGLDRVAFCRASAWNVLKGDARLFAISKLLDFGEFRANFHDT